MNYKFKEIRLNLETDEVSVMVAFQENRNRWKIQEYKFDCPDEIDIDELLDKTKRLIGYE